MSENPFNEKSVTPAEADEPQALIAAHRRKESLKSWATFLFFVIITIIILASQAAFGQQPCICECVCKEKDAFDKIPDSNRPQIDIYGTPNLGPNEKSAPSSPQPHPSTSPKTP